MRSFPSSTVCVCCSAVAVDYFAKSFSILSRKIVALTKFFFGQKRGVVFQPLNVCLQRKKCHSRMNGNLQNHEVSVTSSSCNYSNSNNFHNFTVKKMPRKANREMVGGCCVCSDERGWDENPLVYCDGQGCNVAVHQGKIILSLPFFHIFKSFSFSYLPFFKTVNTHFRYGLIWYSY